MSALKTVFKALLPALERGGSFADRTFNGYVQPRRARGKLILQPYIGWGTPSEVELSGRVLLPRTTQRAMKGDTRLRNFGNVMRRMLSREVGGITVQGTLDGQVVQAVSDLDGYFNLKFTPAQPLPAGWHQVTLTMPGREPLPAHAPLPARVPPQGQAAAGQIAAGQIAAGQAESGRERGSRARVQVIDHARYGVISDLDDTVIQSDVTSVPRMLQTVLTGNARTRLPFPGVGALYRALTRDGQERNPIFYVSSSPWNFFDLLLSFLDYRRIPLGPLFLRNWGFDLLKGHGEYKHGVIEGILNRFPDLPFILVGDSGEKDPEIYAEIVRRFPGRILAVYIRDVTTDAHRDGGVMTLATEVRRAGVELVLARDSLAAAGHALAAGFITPDEYRAVMESIEDTAYHTT